MRLSACLTVLLLLVARYPAFGADFDIALRLERHADAFVVEASVELPVALRTAWEVLTDFEHMADIVGNLRSSRIVRRSGNTLLVAQEGAVRYGIFNYPFASEREIRLEPMKRIVARQIAGTARSYQSEMSLSAGERGTQLRYQMSVVPDSGWARALGAPFVEHEVEEQLAALASEMLRRHAP